MGLCSVVRGKGLLVGGLVGVFAFLSLVVVFFLGGRLPFFFGWFLVLFVRVLRCF